MRVTFEYKQMREAVRKSNIQNVGPNIFISFLTGLRRQLQSALGLYHLEDRGATEHVAGDQEDHSDLPHGKMIDASNDCDK